MAASLLGLHGTGASAGTYMPAATAGLGLDCSGLGLGGNAYAGYGQLAAGHLAGSELGATDAATLAALAALLANGGVGGSASFAAATQPLGAAAAAAASHPVLGVVGPPPGLPPIGTLTCGAAMHGLAQPPSCPGTPGVTCARAALRRSISGGPGRLCRGAGAGPWTAGAAGNSCAMRRHLPIPTAISGALHASHSLQLCSHLPLQTPTPPLPPLSACPSLSSSSRDRIRMRLQPPPRPSRRPLRLLPAAAAPLLRLPLKAPPAPPAEQSGMPRQAPSACHLPRVPGTMVRPTDHNSARNAFPEPPPGETNPLKAGVCPASSSFADL